ncbi:hypothetical protein N7481_002383 [Penicillium waksmanii]|uniref:uncharacterized protein n=1 Tax=Penicillium waksmanii TaxID=69791 RepID=UPI002548C404|nr:uncharacterized protein N7481_002383 [Penicillium waksmanii]KAJ5995406.1 hypothetical protein N7481_002383 [Penicillium waksmanii]
MSTLPTRSDLVLRPHPRQITSNNDNTNERNQISHLSSLPTELLLHIGTHIEKEGDLNALIQTCHHFHNTFQDALYKMCSDPQSKFLWACNHNHIRLAEKMVSRGAITRVPVVPGKPLRRVGRRGRSEYLEARPESLPLMAASRNGYVDMVRFLIGRDRGLIYLLDGVGFSALCYAVQFGHVDVVEVLLGVDEEDEYGSSVAHIIQRGNGMGIFLGRSALNPINIALEWGRVEILKMLLKDGRSGFDKDSLLAAVLGGEVECVRACFEIDTVGEGMDDAYHVFREDELAEACDRGYEDIVLLILDLSRGIDPNRATGRPRGELRTPLISAARSGHEGIVKILLARDDVDPEKPSKSGRTPFCWAAVKGHVGVMKLLLETGKVDVNSQTDDLATPLSCAAAAGEEDSVRFLLSLDEVEVESRDIYGRTATFLAAAKGAAGAVRVLLESRRADPEAKDQIHGFTPLIAAIDQGQFAQKPRSSFFAHELGGAPLPSACQDILNLLRDAGVPVSSDWMKTEEMGYDDLDSERKFVARDALEVMRVFLACPDSVNPNTSRDDGKTPLMHAITRRQVDAVQLLLSSSRIDVNITDKNGQTALEYANEIYRPDSRHLLRDIRSPIGHRPGVSRRRHARTGELEPVEL